ncbi:MAG: Spy/CpxP family protein refolding chaperone [Nitrospinae bacterium]|nr:Spy/CpxP family protein refolding chaperone [Nitrospinota bacterium]
MKKQLVVIVGLLASGVAWAAWPARGEGPRGNGRPQGSGMIHLKQELGLNDAQAMELRKLKSEEKKSAIRKRADLQIARLELHELLNASTVDEKAVSAKVKEVNDLQGSALRARVENRIALQKVLTPEQRAIIDARLAQGLEDIEKGRVLGPFTTAREAMRALRGKTR